MSFTKSCVDCPSYLDETASADFFGDPAIKVPMCARFGSLLAVPLASGALSVNPDIAEKYASTCKDHGKDAPSKPTSKFEPFLFMPDTVKLDVQPNDASVLNCYDCKNYFYSEANNLYGCEVRGMVVYPSQKEKFATGGGGCIWRDKRPASVTVTIKAKPALAPKMDVVASVRPTTVKVAAAKLGVRVIDPRTIDSELPVAERDKGRIRAWIKHPIGNKGKMGAYPIFETDFFGDYAADIPQATQEEGDPSLYVDHFGLMTRFLSVSWTRDQTLALIGEPGSGKTTGARYLSWLMNMPFVHIQYTESTEPEEVLGMPGIKDGDTFIDPGSLPLAWQRPCLLLSDEVNLSQEAILQAYRSMNDSNRRLVVYGQGFDRNDYCFHLVAMNPAHDYRNIGAKEMASADVRRMSYFNVPKPTPDQMKSIIKTNVDKIDGVDLPMSVINVIVSIAEDLQEAAKQAKIPHHWTLSQDIKVARLALDWTLDEAYKIAYFDYIDPKQAEVVMKMIATKIPKGM
jgi:ABC-type dipeptide/oligopeptide/nickel transport system ATPase component